MMKGIIFAAGKSSRLGELTKSCPKICLEIEDGKTILDRALASIIKNGIKDLIIVTGHASEKISEAITPYKNNFDSLELIFNDHYSDRNNIYTAYLIRERITEDTLIFNSDIVYDPQILANAVTELNKNPQSFLVVDDHKPLVDEDMKVLLDSEAKIQRINKNLDNSKCSGEYIGILRLAGKDIQRFNSSLEKIIENKEFSVYYEDALDRITDQLEINILSTRGLAWTEIDTPEDYKRAKKIIADLNTTKANA
jgi:L-glutamine-phosphate cytidylyltransferase